MADKDERRFELERRVTADGTQDTSPTTFRFNDLDDDPPFGAPVTDVVRSESRVPSPSGFNDLDAAEDQFPALPSDSSGDVNTRQILAKLLTGSAKRETTNRLSDLEWREMASSNVARAAYDPDSMELLVDFVDGTPWSYFGIPEETAQLFFTAASPRGFINDNFTPPDGSALVPHGRRLG